MGGNSSQSGRKTKNFFFGEVTKKKSYNKEFITVSRPILNKDLFDDWKQKFDVVKSMNNKEAIFLPDNYDFKYTKKSMKNTCRCCDADGETQMTYEDIDFLFHSELLNRKSKKAYYQESQLLLIMYKLLEGSKQFQRKQISLGDIRPKNILVTKEGQIKMINVASFVEEKTALDKITQNFDNKTIFFLAPEEVEYIKSRGYSNKDSLPNAKTEAFSIGLTVLEACNLESSQDIYNMPTRQINIKLLQSRLHQVAKKYHLLHQFLSSILKLDSSQRMSSGECWSALRVYSQKITQLQPFKRHKNSQNESIRKFFAGGSSSKG